MFVITAFSGISALVAENGNGSEVYIRFVTFTESNAIVPCHSVSLCQ